MGKTLVINLEDVVLQGDILDVGEKNLGIIYSISKEAKDELSLDYVSSNTKVELKDRQYDACTFFFDLNKIWTSIEKERLIREISSYLKESGEIYIWDINKERGKVFNNKIKVILPNEKIKEFTFKNLNILLSSNIEEIKKILEKYFEIEETKAWEDVFFVRGKKLKTKAKVEEKINYEGTNYSD
jgi:ubiquinone/menaquinone biosynthesis C-methylase UbiE